VLKKEPCQYAKADPIVRESERVCLFWSIARIVLIKSSLSVEVCEDEKKKKRRNVTWAEIETIKQKVMKRRGWSGIWWLRMLYMRLSRNNASIMGIKIIKLEKSESILLFVLLWYLPRSSVQMVFSRTIKSKIEPNMRTPDLVFWGKQMFFSLRKCENSFWIFMASKRLTTEDKLFHWNTLYLLIIWKAKTLTQFIYMNNNTNHNKNGILYNLILNRKKRIVNKINQLDKQNPGSFLYSKGTEVSYRPRLLNNSNGRNAHKESCTIFLVN